VVGRSPKKHCQSHATVPEAAIWLHASLRRWEGQTPQTPQTPTGREDLLRDRNKYLIHSVPQPSGSRCRAEKWRWRRASEGRRQQKVNSAILRFCDGDKLHQAFPKPSHRGIGHPHRPSASTIDPDSTLHTPHSTSPANFGYIGSFSSGGSYHVKHAGH
jgi:hypothetical protein